MRNPFFTTRSGIQFDLVEPKVDQVDFKDAAYHLSQMCRFGGAAKPFYSVGHHLLYGLGFCDHEIKPYWLAHDVQEYVGQDDTTPKKRALPLVMERKLRDKFPLADIEKFKDAIRESFEVFEDQLSEVVHRAAGLEWPVPPDIKRQVKELDTAMLEAEWNALMPGEVPGGYRHPNLALDLFGLPRRAQVENILLADFRLYFPALRARAA